MYCFVLVSLLIPDITDAINSNMLAVNLYCPDLNTHLLGQVSVF